MASAETPVELGLAFAPPVRFVLSHIQRDVDPLLPALPAHITDVLDVEPEADVAVGVALGQVTPAQVAAPLRHFAGRGVIAADDGRAVHPVAAFEPRAGVLEPGK